MLKKSDIYNIQRACGLRRAEKHQDDTTSVAMWVEENEAKDFFCFHPLSQDNENFILGKDKSKYNNNFEKIHSELSIHIFMGIQTPTQSEKLIQFAPSVICMDATHGVTHYKGYLLVTIMVITDQGKGYPAAWFIVSKETEDVLTICLKALRERYVLVSLFD